MKVSTLLRSLLHLNCFRLSAGLPASSAESQVAKAQRESFSIFQVELTDDQFQKFINFWSPYRKCLLKKLLLSGNKLTRVPPLDAFPNLRNLNISDNDIQSLDGLDKAPFKLEALYASNNYLSKIQHTENLLELRLLELRGNAIQEMEGLENMTLLKELSLAFNYIQDVNLCGLRMLVKLNLQSNCLVSVNGLEACVSLEELHLGDNQISSLVGLSTLVNLRVLDVSENLIEDIEGIENLERLEDLWLDDNDIQTVDDIDKRLAGAKESLTTIFLERNLCTSDPYYEEKLVASFPNLQQIDSSIVWWNF